MSSIYDQAIPISEEDRDRAVNMLGISSIAYGLAELYKHLTLFEVRRMQLEVLQTDLKPQIRANYLAFSEGKYDEEFMDSLGLRNVAEKILEKRIELPEKRQII